MNLQKKQEELNFARSFLGELNRLYGWDYKPIPNNDESFHDPEIDIYARSTKLAELQLQIKIIDKDYKKDFANRRKEVEYNQSNSSCVSIRNLEPIKWAKQTIAECSKKYEPGVRNRIILLLCVYHATKMDTAYVEREFIEYRQSDFKGIYFINPSHDNCANIEQLISVKALS